MRLTHLLSVVAAGFGLASPLFAQSPPSPVSFDKAFSADQIITTRDGETITSKIYNDNGRVRTEMTVHGMNIIAIVLPDEKKVYSIMPAQKMVMLMPYDPEKYKKFAVGTAGFDGKYELVGPETVDGVATVKYKVTTSDKASGKDKVYFLWAEPATKLPVKMAAEDGSFAAAWKNYKAGPQDASLFVVPSDYQVMTMPVMPGAGGGGPGQ